MKLQGLYLTKYIRMDEQSSREKVMVVRTKDLFFEGKWEGLRDNNIEKYLEIITTKYEFVERSIAEYDDSYQQIIPYLVFHHQDSFFVIRKLKGSSETRLHHRFMMGVGGHINNEDDGSDILENGIRREWEEEVAYEGTYTKKLVGILNDSSTPVSSVHLGLIYLVTGESDQIQSAEPDKMSGEFVHLNNLRDYYDRMDSWGQIVVRWLEQGKPESGGVFR